VTSPRSDAQSTRTLLRRPHFHPLDTDPANLPSYSMTAPAQTPLVPQTTLPTSLPAASASQEHVQERAFDFASHSWDLAPGGLKTLTAKRAVPVLPERRSHDNLQETVSLSRSSMFPLIIAVCVLLMLTSGGVVLFVMLQP
jgi:hypothetical protein